MVYAEEAAEEDMADEVEDAEDEDPKEIIKQMDKDGDGKLSLTELYDGVLGDDEEKGDQDEQDKLKAKLQKHFKTSDSDGDQTLDEAELKALMEAFENDDEEL